jgi:hypothetical protein
MAAGRDVTGQLAVSADNCLRLANSCKQITENLDLVAALCNEPLLDGEAFFTDTQQVCAVGRCSGSPFWAHRGTGVRGLRVGLAGHVQLAQLRDLMAEVTQKRLRLMVEGDVLKDMAALVQQGGQLVSTATSCPTRAPLFSPTPFPTPFLSRRA